MSEIDKIKKKVNALLAKTVNNGCTEKEALFAAEKAGELMDHYQLSMTDLEIKEQNCVKINVETGGVKRGPIDNCVIALARYCDVKIWFSKGHWGKETVRDAEGNVVYKKNGYSKLKSVMHSSKYGVFGLKSDTELFEYLFDVINTMMRVELEAFKASDSYSNAYDDSWALNEAGAKTSATMSFQSGMAEGISSQLHDMKEARQREMKEASGRDLVILKGELIEQEFADTGIRLRTSYSRNSGGNHGGARGAGYSAGQNVNLNGGIAGSSSNNARIA